MARKRGRKLGIFCSLVAAAIQPLITDLSMILHMDRVETGFLVTAITGGIVLVASILWLAL